MNGEYLLCKVLVDVPIPELKLNYNSGDIKTSKIRNDEECRPIDVCGPVTLSLLLATWRRQRDIELAVEGPIRQRERELLEHDALWLRFRSHYDRIIREIESDPYVTKYATEQEMERLYMIWLQTNIDQMRLRYPPVTVNGITVDEEPHG